MVSIIDNNTSTLLSMALDAAVLRQQAIAHNIANANTPNYQRMSVSFERHLDMLRDGRGNVGAASAAQLAQLRPTVEYGAPGQKIALDQEMVELSETTMHHQFLLKALQRQMALVGMAINEGKR